MVLLLLLCGDLQRAGAEWIEEKPLSEWFSVPREEAEVALEEPEGYTRHFRWRIVQKGDKITVRVFGGFGDLDWPKEQMDLSENGLVFSRPHRLQRLDEGWLAGYGLLHLGSEIRWFSPDGEESYKISDHQVNQFLVTDDGVFAAEGLTYIDAPEWKGSVIRLSKSDGKWTTETLFTKENGDPRGIVETEDGKLIVLSEPGCWTLSKDGVSEKHEELSKIVFPDRFSTAGRLGSTIYVGSELFVMAIDLNTFEYRYLIPTEEHWQEILDSYEEP